MSAASLSNVDGAAQLPSRIQVRLCVLCPWSRMILSGCNCQTCHSMVSGKATATVTKVVGARSRARALMCILSAVLRQAWGNLR
jgi:hypothetical protein